MAISLAPQELFGQNQNALKFQKKCKADIFYFDLGLALLTGPPSFLKKKCVSDIQDVFRKVPSDLDWLGDPKPWAAPPPGYRIVFYVKICRNMALIFLKEKNPA
jgi:hypothetical protein